MGMVGGKEMSRKGGSGSNSSGGRRLRRRGNCALGKEAWDWKYEPRADSPSTSMSGRPRVRTGWSVVVLSCQPHYS